MVNGATLNIHGCGRIIEEPQSRASGDGSFVSVRLAQWPEDDGKRKALPMKLDLKLRKEQAPPRKGDLILIDSGTYHIGTRTNDDGSTSTYHNLVAWFWRILPASAAMVPEAKGAGAGEKLATPDKPSLATPPPPPSIKDEDEEVPF